MFSYPNRKYPLITSCSLILFFMYYFQIPETTSPLRLSRKLRTLKTNDLNNENYVKLSDTLDGYVARYQVGSKDVEPKLSATVQVSWNKIDTLKVLSERWSGPISCSVLYDGDKKSMDKDMQELIQSWPKRAQPIIFHMVLQKEKQPYPINIMRNFSMEHAPTDIVFIIDSDFVPSLNTWEKLLVWVYDRDGLVALEQKNAFVVPAFEYILSNRDFIPLEELPETKDKLLQRLESDKLIKPFHIDYWKRGHRATDYNKWYKASQPYHISWEPRYEPYIVVDRRKTPRFWEKFVGFGYNKLSFIMELHNNGFHFHVLPDVFLIHRNHPGREERSSDQAMRDEYFNNFRPYLMKKYNREYIWDAECELERCY